ncbi:hypothetical protein ALC57_00798, partial [Trachymyrmex cornetzi]
IAYALLPHHARSRSVRSSLNLVIYPIFFSLCSTFTPNSENGELPYMPNAVLIILLRFLGGKINVSRGGITRSKAKSGDDAGLSGLLHGGVSNGSRSILTILAPYSCLCRSSSTASKAASTLRRASLPGKFKRDEQSRLARGKGGEARRTTVTGECTGVINIRCSFISLLDASYRG